MTKKTMKGHGWVAGILEIYNDLGDVDRAEPMKKYMRDQFDFFGIKSTERRSAGIEYMKKAGLPDRNDMETVVMELWHRPERECQYFAIELLIKMKKLWVKHDIHLFERLIVEKSWWDTVDYLANHIIGPWFKKYPEAIPSITGKWNTSKNIWLQRSSILFQLKYKKETDTALLEKYILNLITSKEFFVKKAIGWSLREYSKTDSDFVRKFVKKHPLQPLSAKEALKWLDR
jgi:3-methyladenine DNA glycosylase AlkD